MKNTQSIIQNKAEGAILIPDKIQLKAELRINRQFNNNNYRLEYPTFNNQVNQIADYKEIET